MRALIKSFDDASQEKITNMTNVVLQSASDL